MDTRFWGPSGWRLLHLIATSPYAAKSRKFWQVLPFVLPCKFCRASLTTYYEQHPIPTQTNEFEEWLYTIHNCVNDKLRKQGQSIPPDPPFEAVHKRYTELLEQGCTLSKFIGWEFLFCIADNHPGESPSTPMPDCPVVPPKQLFERNKYNICTTQERTRVLQVFWKELPKVFPFAEWQTSWKRHAMSIKHATRNRKQALKWLWKIRCGMDHDLHNIQTHTFHGLCKELQVHRSGCGTNIRAKTCRKQRFVGGAKRKTQRHKQR